MLTCTPATRSLFLALCCCWPASPATARQDVEVLSSVRAGEVPESSRLVEGFERYGAVAVDAWGKAVDEAPAHARAALLAQGRECLEVLASRRDVGTSDVQRADRALAGLRLAERVAGSGDLVRILTVARTPEEGDVSRWRSVRRTLDEVLRTVVTREPDGFQVAARLYGQRDWPEALSLARGIGASGRRQALDVLESLLGVHPENDASLLGEIGNLSDGLGYWLSTSGISRVRDYLDSRDPHVRRQAVYALGRLEDYDSVEVLLDRLDDEDGGVRRVAHWALQRITRMTIAQDPPRWRTWFREESAWWAERSPNLLAVLRRSNAAKDLVAVLNEAGAKRLFRPQLTPEIVPLLGHDQEEVVRMALSALLSLRSREALPEIVPLLDRPEGEVRDLALRVLTELTGKELPPERAAWEAAVPAAVPR